MVIERMREKYGGLKGCEWEVQDVRELAGVGDGEVDVAIDKGTLDAFIYGSLWDPPTEVRGNIGAYVDQVCGCFLTCAGEVVWEGKGNWRWDGKGNWRWDGMRECTKRVTKC